MSSASADAGETCDRALKIEGPPDRVSALREALRDSSLHAPADAACNEAQVSLQERDGGYSVALALGSSRVERRVASISAAATWVEGWMADAPVDAHQPAATTASATPPEAARTPIEVQPDRGAPPPAPARVIFVAPAAQLALVGTSAAGNDGSVWAGGELFARLQISPTLWMGAALGFEGDTTVTGPADEVDGTKRYALRASGRGGARLPLSSRVDLLLGGGTGVTWGMAMRTFGAEDEDIDHGGFFLEAHADASFHVSERFSLLAGIAGRGRFLSVREKEDETERQMPDAMPPVTAELRIGAGWDFGGTR